VAWHAWTEPFLLEDHPIEKLTQFYIKVYQTVLLMHGAKNCLVINDVSPRMFPY
jgi:hypothetical protein